MICEHIHLNNYFPMLEYDCYLDTYCPKNLKEFSSSRKRRAILVIPGGGYEFVSEREGEPIALQFVSEDIASFVLTYKVGEFNFPNPMIQVFAALAYIRNNSEKYHIDENRIGLLGFSAGGHLSAITTLFCQNEEYAKFLSVPISKIKVNALMLGYPVITMTSPTHGGTRDRITHGDERLIDDLSVEKHISKNFPPTFIWTTASDTCVPPAHSINLAKELVNNGIPCEFHMFPQGPHGLALANENTNENDHSTFLPIVHTWIKHAISFVKTYL